MIINGERALAYIVTVEEIKPIDGYDRIELARTHGWWCVVSKDSMKVGDKAVFFEIDSLLPKTDERFAFTEKYKYKIKTQRMCKGKVLSQGLLMPASTFPELGDPEIGTDVTEKLGVRYYVEEDNKRKAKTDPNAKYKSMAARHRKVFSMRPIRWLMRREWGRKLLFLFFGRKKNQDKSFPTKFVFVHKTDEDRCLTGDTKIETNIGIKRIADIVNKRMDVLVRSYNPDNNQIEYKKITDYQKTKMPETMIRITFPYKVDTYRGNSIKCTGDHRFYVGNNTYIRADELKKDQVIYTKTTGYDDDAISVIYGCLLGDASLSIDKRCGSLSPRVQFTQGQDQIDYLNDKKRLFGRCASKLYKVVSGYTDKDVYKFNLKLDKCLSNALYRDRAIKDNKLEITREYCDRLSLASLAFWYCDDGSLRDSIRHPEIYSSLSIRISTNAFSKNENDLLVDALGKFGVTANIQKNKGYYELIINKDNTYKFLELISPYIPYSMRYKTIPQFENVPYIYDSVSFETYERLIDVPIRSVEKYRYKSISGRCKHVYDISVDGNHNFFANGILTHNCENVWEVLDKSASWTQTTKIDGTSSTYILERLPKGKFEYYVCSRNVRQLKEDQDCYHETNVYWEMDKKYHIRDALEDILKKHNGWDYVCLQGETAGQNLQGNPHKFPDVRFFGFNFIDSMNGRWKSEDGKYLMAQYDIPWVPIIDTNYHLPETLEELKAQADGQCEAPDAQGLREGYVYRRNDDPNISFKNVSNEYLLWKKE